MDDDTRRRRAQSQLDSTYRPLDRNVANRESERWQAAFQAERRNSACHLTSSDRPAVQLAAAGRIFAESFSVRKRRLT